MKKLFSEINLQDFFVKYYDIRPFHNPIINKVVGNSSKILVSIANLVLPYLFSKYPYSPAPNLHENAPVVCLTSFPARINKVWLVIECLLRQTMTPYKIILYLSKDQFPNLNLLPKDLLKLQSDLFCIKLKDGDYKSHKKYWYAISEYPDRPIITADDDIIYPSNVVERLVMASETNPKVVPAIYTSIINWKDGVLLPYSKWRGWPELNCVSSKIFFGSGGGVLFPIGSLNGADDKIDNIMKVCPTADDIWLNCIVRKNGYKVMAIDSHISVPEWKNKHNVSLSYLNNTLNQNDKQLYDTIEYFKNQYNIEMFKYNPEENGNK